MKKMNLVVLGLLALTSAANATMLPTVRTAEITGGEVDGAYGFPSGELTGSISVDPFRKKISFYVQSGPMFVCLAIGCAPPAPSLQVVELPIVKISTNACGVVTFVAVRDQRPVDGMYEKVVVRDHSSMKCRYMPEAMTILDHTTISPGFGGPVVKTSTRLLGDSLSNGYDDVIRPLPFEIDAEDTDETIAE